MKRTLHARHSFIVLAALLLIPFTADAFSLAWPIDCELGKTCFIQNYMEHGHQPRPVDFACNPTSFSGLTGTDIRIQSLAAMRAGVPVRAAADGVVTGMRDGMDDIATITADPPELKGRECGNGLYIRDAEGYVVHYCHLRKGSVRAHTGQQIKTGDALGLVGLSGNTQFPHLHIGVEKNGAYVDPFTSTPASTACDATLATTAPHQLWATPVPYMPISLLNDGFADTRPDEPTMLDTPVNHASQLGNIPLAYWVDLLNLQAGDIMTISILKPDGTPLIGHRKRFTEPGAKHFDFVGKFNTDGPLPPGMYRGRLQVLRNDQAVIDVTRTVTIQ